MIKYRPEIDGLRAVAVLAVVIFHAGFNLFGIELFPGGYIGVDVFFVISGYLITSIILKDIGAANFSYANFYERRARRILPALFVTILVSAPFAYWLLLSSQLSSYVYSILSALGFSSNIYFSQQDSYWSSPSLLQPFLHTWSLSVEEQFYIFFPPLLFILIKAKSYGLSFHRKVSALSSGKYFSNSDDLSTSNYLTSSLPIRGISKDIGSYSYDALNSNSPSKNKLLFIFISLSVISLISSQILSSIYSEAAFYLLPTRAWELMAGAILVVVPSRDYKNKQLVKVLPAIGILTICLSFIYFDNSTQHPSIITTIPILGTMAFIYFASNEDPISKLLSNRFVVGVGLVSYSYYLIHYPLFAFCRIAGIMSSNMEKLSYCLIALMLGIVSYMFIERPFRNKHKVSLRAFYVWASCLFVLILMLMTFFLYHIYTLEKRDPKVAQIANVAFHNLYDDKGRRCHNLPTDQPCAFLSDFNKTGQFIVLVGDSHAGAVAHSIKDLADEMNLNFIQFTVDSCAFIPNISLDSKEKEARCNLGQANVKKFLNEHPSSIIIYVARWPHHLLEKSKGGFYEYTNVNVLEELKNWLGYLHKHSGKLIVFESIPQFPYNVRDKFLKESELKPVSQVLSNLVVPISSYISYAQEANTILTENIKYSDVKIISPQSVLCDEGNCFAANDISLLYNDHGHLSQYGSEILIDSLKGYLHQFLKDRK